MSSHCLIFVVAIVTLPLIHVIGAFLRIVVPDCPFLAHVQRGKYLEIDWEQLNNFYFQIMV